MPAVRQRLFHQNPLNQHWPKVSSFTVARLSLGINIL